MSKFMFKDDRIGPGIVDAMKKLEESRTTAFQHHIACQEAAEFKQEVIRLYNNLALARQLIEEYAGHPSRCACIKALPPFDPNKWDTYLAPPIEAEGCDCGLTEKWKAVKG